MAKTVTSTFKGKSTSISDFLNPKGNTEKTFEQTLQDMSSDVSAQTFAFNSSEAEKERNWSEYMSNTSHQREVDDLKRAGLNPVLSANSGAQSYSGASASGSADNSAIGALASIYQTQMNNDNAMKIAKMNNETSLKLGKINAAASNYASMMASSASKYASDNAYGASIYGANHSMYGAINEFIEGLTGGNPKSNGQKLGKNKIVSWITGKFFK